MASSLHSHIQEGLAEKRRNLNNWLESAPVDELECCLAGKDQQAVQAHLQIIDTALQKIENKTLGLCEVCHGYVDTRLLEMDYTARVCLDHFSDEERRRLESELELSQVVQKALLPQRIPAIAGLELAAFSRPAEIIGGDYFDFLHFRDQAPGLAIADVVGHGVAAGMLMSGLQTALHTLVPESDTPVEVLERINRFYLHNVHFTTFVTVFLAHFDPTHRTLTYANAGHTPPILFRRNDRKVDWLSPNGPAVGLVENYRLKAEAVTLAEGDILLLYTDGITEAMNPQREQFGEGRLATLIGENADLSAQEIIYALRQAVSDFTAGRPLADDTTIVVCKVGL